MKKIKNTILLLGQPEIMNMESDDSIIDSGSLTKILLVVLLAKNFSDLVIIFVEFIKNILN